MSQPVLLSTGLVLDARMTSELLERSIAGQIEFWARIGQAIEPLLQGTQSLALSRARKAMPLSKCMAMLDSPAGRKRLTTYLQSEPYPHFEPAPGQKGLLVRTEANGQKTLGRFIRREFRPVTTAKK
jgi:hypothetical protein